LKLRFARRRVIEGVDFDDPQKRKEPWLARVALTPEERNQVVACVFGNQATAQEVFSGDFDFFDNQFPGFAEVPIEWWDVIDDSGVRYQLWLFGVDGGVLVDAGTVNEVAHILQFGFDGDQALADALADAQKLAVKDHPESELASIDFV
jgi:hypothetical protein